MTEALSEAAFDAEDLAGSYERLRARWETSREPALADALEELAAHVDTEAMRALEASRVGTLDERAETFASMADLAPDPQLGRALLGLVRRVPVCGHLGFWRAVCAALPTHADPRQSERFERLVTTYDQSQALHEYIVVRRCFVPIADDWREVLEDLEPLSGPEVKALAKIADAIGALPEEPADDVERSMVRAIVDDPSNDAPRRAYAEWLAARGDGRGDFIALDLDLAAGKRVKGKREKALTAHQGDIVGPLAPLLTYPKMERGFIHDVTLHPSLTDLPASEQRTICRDMRWALVERLALRPHHAPLLTAAPLWSLRTLRCDGLASLAGLPEREGTLDVLELDVAPAADEDDWELLEAAGRKLPALAELAILIWTKGSLPRRATPPATFFATELVRRVTRLRCGGTASGGFCDLAEWLDAMEAGGAAIPEIVFVSGKMVLRATRRDAGDYDSTLAVGRLRRAKDADGIVPIVERLRDEGRVASITVSHADDSDADARARIDELL